MELRASRLRGHHGPYDRFILAGTAERRYVLGRNDDWYAIPGDNMTFRQYIVWIQVRRTHDELIDEWKKRMTIRSCKAIKEELMMNRWHPDRVEKMVDAGTLEQLW
jgi:hypothetical protein